MILEPGNLPVLVYALFSFGSKEEVRIVFVSYPRFVFLLDFGKQSVFLCA
ncbi:hypothetical protein M2298_000078 [Brevibacillus sp. 1238]|jgi:hypothetical protein|uniref:Uncharacterized protein n=1 Tax=Brevibacillus parabrevis TaxID=54914 RepID=A0A4Y3PD00_BREPA|nr:hypothetical protein [Brevibacillus sp. 1238]GEB30505.1 hypothetical protein BPA01_00850 [Brevibacillus parabrevis]